MQVVGAVSRVRLGQGRMTLVSWGKHVRLQANVRAPKWQWSRSTADQVLRRVPFTPFRPIPHGKRNGFSQRFLDSGVLMTFR